MSLPYQRKLIDRARELRKRATPQEDKLWYRFLKDYPVRFQRQKIIDTFIADFYCHEACLIIEIDGAPHFTAAGQEYDRMRSAVLERYGLEVIRFTNGEIENQFMSVCSRIDLIVKERTE
ncbi:MAG: endonuclease domain-containing protein [Clostridia bacterium]|nr:endonuclease domain-containing protein [Clostridia bacterium]